MSHFEEEGMGWSFSRSIGAGRGGACFWLQLLLVGDREVHLRTVIIHSSYISTMKVYSACYIMIIPNTCSVDSLYLKFMY